jgi:beta-fructofuranosidase
VSASYLTIIAAIWFIAVASTSMACASSPLADAVAAWGMADASGLAKHGDVKTGIALADEERAASLARGGDGFVAQFTPDSFLNAGQRNITGRGFTLCTRLRDSTGTWMAPLVSKYGGHDKLVYNLFSHDLGQGPVIGFELGIDGASGMLQVAAPLKVIGPTDWHDVVCRFDGIRVQLFIDGVLMDEAFAPQHARLRSGNVEPCLIGAESDGAAGAVRSRFRGAIDHVALWSRAISDAEIEALSGGRDVVAAKRQQYLGASPSMQYFRPHNRFNVGDTLPFFRGDQNGGDTFHFVYLLDRGHHSQRNGLGAHQWAHVTSRDLVNWTERPHIIPIENDDEGSICTGSLFFHDGVYYAWYATRGFDRVERLSLATSTDGVRFTKRQPNPFLVPPDKYVNGFRDPHVFRDARTGLFHLIVSTMFKDGNRGCLAQYTSRDLKTWTEAEPLLVEGGEVPECPDYFEWNGWYYLLFSHGQVARYRMSRNPLGPWERPKVEILDGGAARVMKTAAFTGNRRIGTASIWPHGYAGWSVFRELVQHADGTLGNAFVPEMIPATGEPVSLSSSSGSSKRVHIASTHGAGEALLTGVPRNGRIRMRVDAGAKQFGLRLASSDESAKRHELIFDQSTKTVSLAGGKTLHDVEGLHRPFTLDVILKDNILDICVDGRRTMINWVPDVAVDRLILFARDGEATFSDIEARPLAAGERARAN